MPDDGCVVDPSKLRQKDSAKKYEVIDLDADAHYPVINEWWGKYYEGDSIPRKCVPKYGCVVIFKGKPVASCFLYINDSAMCHMDFCIADPELGAGNRCFFLRAIIDAGKKKAKEVIGEDAIIWTLTDNAVVSRMYRERGFKCMGEGDCFVFTEDETEDVMYFLS